MSYTIHFGPEVPPLKNGDSIEFQSTEGDGYVKFDVIRICDKDGNPICDFYPEEKP